MAQAQRVRGRISLLLTDVVMPASGGRHVAERVRASALAAAVVYMSGHHDDAVLDFGIEDGAARFLAKPFTPAELVRKVREALAAGPLPTRPPLGPRGQAVSRSGSGGPSPRVTSSADNAVTDVLARATCPSRGRLRFGVRGLGPLCGECVTRPPNRRSEQGPRGAGGEAPDVGASPTRLGGGSRGAWRADGKARRPDVSGRRPAR